MCFLCVAPSVGSLRAPAQRGDVPSFGETERDLLRENAENCVHVCVLSMWNNFCVFQAVRDFRLCCLFRD